MYISASGDDLEEFHHQIFLRQFVWFLAPQDSISSCGRMGLWVLHGENHKLQYEKHSAVYEKWSLQTWELSVISLLRGANNKMISLQLLRQRFPVENWLLMAEGLQDSNFVGISHPERGQSWRKSCVQ